MEFNDLIFKELLKRGYSLDGKTRVWNLADSKLLYITTEQAQAYLDLILEEESASAKGTGETRAMSWPKEMNLTNEHMKDILDEIRNESINVIDLGCENGKRAAWLIENIKKKAKKIKYCPIDISSHMVEHAIEAVEKSNPDIKVQWNISDFDNLENIVPLLRKGEFKKSIFLLLGNSLGNFEIHELLYNIRSAMKEGDILLIGNGLNNHKTQEELVKACRANKGFDKFLGYIPLQLGFEREDIEYNARFKNSRIEFFYTIKKDKTISFQNKKVPFSKGDQIIVAMAYQYNKEDFLGYLTMYFGEVELFTSKDGSYALALCEK
jgi:uncharacterized SAM-dependent methyltransferase